MTYPSPPERPLPPAQATPPAASPVHAPAGAAPAGQYSADGRWYWDGWRWVAVARPGPAWARAYAPAAARAAGAIALLAVAAAAAVVFLLSETLDIAAAAVPAAGSAAVPLLVVSAFLSLVGVVGAAIGVPMWMHRSYRNLPALGGERLSWSPGWAAGAWFIPVANLVIPYLIARELWTGTGGPGQRPWRLLAPWWAAWVLAGGLQVAANLVMTVDRVAGDVLGILNALATLTAGLLLIQFIRLVTGRQEVRYATLAAAGGA